MEFNIVNLRVSTRNLRTAHHRLLAQFLRKRGWVTFYLEEEHRKCNNACWLRLYQHQTSEETK